MQQVLFLLWSGHSSPIKVVPGTASRSSWCVFLAVPRTNDNANARVCYLTFCGDRVWTYVLFTHLFCVKNYKYYHGANI